LSHLILMWESVAPRWDATSAAIVAKTERHDVLSCRDDGRATLHSAAEIPRPHNVPVTTSAAQAAAFYEEAERLGAVWAIRDDGGFPAPMSGHGVRTMPFWSLRSRAERTIATTEAYAAFQPVDIPLDVFVDRWLPGLATDGVRVGLNWSGSRATGYDVDAKDVLARFTSTAG
jgi:hypothetical protein